MKNLIYIGLLILISTVFVSSASAQNGGRWETRYDPYSGKTTYCYYPYEGAPCHVYPTRPTTPSTRINNTQQVMVVVNNSTTVVQPQVDQQGYYPDRSPRRKYRRSRLADDQVEVP